MSAESKPHEQTARWDVALSDYVVTLVCLVPSLASPVLAVLQVLGVGGAEAFFVLNSAPIHDRLVAIGVSWGFGLVGALTLLVLSRFSREPFEWRRRARSLAAPGIIAAFVPILFVPSAWEGRDIAYLVYLLLCGLSLEQLSRAWINVASHLPVVKLTHAFVSRPKVDRILGWVALVLAVGAATYYFGRIGHLTNVGHRRLLTASSDLAEYDNLFFNALHGHPFRSPGVAALMKDWSNLSNHAELCVYILLPFYAISPGAQTLLWIQTGVVAFSAVPIYLLASARLGRIVGLAFVCAFLAMPAVEQPNFYDFHFTSAAMFFVAWTIYFTYASCRRPQSIGYKIGLYLCTAGALSCREDVGIGIAVFGFFLIVSRYYVREGIKIALFGGIYFVTMKFVIMPLFGTWWFDTMYEDLKSEGAKGFGSIVMTLLSNQAFILRTLFIEAKALYVLHMTVPLLALWLRRPLLLLAFLPGFVSTLLVTNRPPLFQASFQYTYLWLPYVVAASILAVQKGVQHRLAICLPLLLGAASLDCQKGVLLGGDHILGGFGIKSFEVTDFDRQRLRDLEAVIALIPKNASVTVSEAEGPHVSARLVMYSLKYSLGHDPDYILVGNLGGGETAHLREALESGKYGLIASRGQFTLFKRGADPRRNGPMLQRVGGRLR